MEKGTIVKLVADKGFGFIRGSDNAQYFVHKSKLNEGLTWDELTVGQTVEFTPCQGKKGMEATAVKMAESTSSFKSIDDIPGKYGLIAIDRGNYTNLEKGIEECDGLAFGGLGTFGGRFPNNTQLISMLREMRAVFDREHKIWFLRATLVPANFERIEELIKTAKRIHRDKVISQWIIGFFSTLIAVTVGAFIIAGVVLVMALAIFGGFGGNLFGSPFRAKVSRTGNVWVGNNRIT